MPAQETISLLESARQSLEKATGLPVCIYDFTYFSHKNPALLLPIASREHHCRFCELAKRNPDAAIKALINVT